MGRWAQYRHRGSSPNPPVELPAPVEDSDWTAEAILLAIHVTTTDPYPVPATQLTLFQSVNGSAFAFLLDLAPGASEDLGPYTPGDEVLLEAEWRDDVGNVLSPFSPALVFDF